MQNLLAKYYNKNPQAFANYLLLRYLAATKKGYKGTFYTWLNAIPLRGRPKK